MFLAEIFSYNMFINEAVGGLFDFNATLPLVGVQFVLLTVLLTFILYKPVFSQKERRKEYNEIVLGDIRRLLSQDNRFKEIYVQKTEKWFSDAETKRSYFARKSKERMSTKVESVYQDAAKAVQSVANQLKEERVSVLTYLELEIRRITFLVIRKLLPKK
jgi:F-type H+-transporting ATPase subunit b